MKTLNYGKIQRVLVVILFANLLVAVLKIAYGYAIASISLRSDGFHSLTDGSSNIIGLIGIFFGSKPVDEKHPYGHRKFEVLAGLMMAGMLFVTGGKVLLDAFIRFVNPVSPIITIESLVMLLLTLFVNILVSWYEYREGKKLDSLILVMDSMHTRSDIFVSIGVLMTLIGLRLGFPVFIDSLVSLVVAGFILHAAFSMYRESSSILVDQFVVDPELIKNISLQFEDVKDVHQIRSRGNQDELFVDMHMLMEPATSIEKSHELSHQIEQAIQIRVHKNVQLIAHLEPLVAEDHLLHDA